MADAALGQSVFGETWRFAIVVGMLAGACASDMRTRRVRDAYWVPFAATAAGFALADLAVAGAREWVVPYALAGGACALLYGLWSFHFFGGADAKGLMVAAFLLPAAPSWTPGAATLPVLDILVNGSLLSLAIPVALGAWNLGHGRWRGAATFLGVPMDIGRARRSHVWPLERATPDGLRWRLWQRRGEDLEAAYDALAAAGATTVWATPKVPFMVPLALGAAAAGLCGNLVLWPLMGILP